MEQHREPRDRLRQIESTNFWQKDKGNSLKKGQWFQPWFWNSWIYIKKKKKEKLHRRWNQRSHFIDEETEAQKKKKKTLHFQLVSLSFLAWMQPCPERWGGGGWAVTSGWISPSCSSSHLFWQQHLFSNKKSVLISPVYLTKIWTTCW